MTARLTLVLGARAAALRLPSLVQPMGADQALYAYVGERILAGGLPYRDAWDQKPPAIHFLYAGLRAVWPRRCRRAGSRPRRGRRRRACCSIGSARLTGRRRNRRRRGACSSSCCRTRPSPRLGGVRLRSQCETFIAVAVTAAHGPAAARGQAAAGRRTMIGAGVLFGLAFAFKYNAAVFAVAGVVALWLHRRLTVRRSPQDRPPASCCRSLTMPVDLRCRRRAAAALSTRRSLYNLAVLGRDLRGARSTSLRYLMTFPIERARVDALWTVGGAGCLLLLAGALGSAGAPRARSSGSPPRALSIAINGSRGLAAVLRPGQSGARARRRMGRRSLAWTWLRGARPGGAARRRACGARRDRRGLAGRISSRSSSSRRSSTPATPSARCRATPTSRATTTTASTRRSRGDTLGEYLRRAQPADRSGLRLRLHLRGLRRRRSRERLAVLLEPAGHRRLQRRPARLRRRGPARRPQRQSPGGRRPAAARLGARRRRLGGVLHEARRRSSGWLRAALRAGDRTRRLRRLAATERDAVIARPPLDARRFAGVVAAHHARGARPAPVVSHRRSAVDDHGRHRLARRRRVGPQRAQQGAVRTWSADAWNPMFIAPVFTGLEYAVVRARSASASGRRAWSRS